MMAMPFLDHDDLAVMMPMTRTEAVVAVAHFSARAIALDDDRLGTGHRRSNDTSGDHRGDKKSKLLHFVFLHLSGHLTATRLRRSAKISGIF